MRLRRTSVFVAVLLLAANGALAAGFRLPEAGAKAMGMAMAFTAQADDPSAIYYNPAGLVQLEGTNTMVGGTYVRGNGADFTGATPLTAGATVAESQKDLNFFLPNAYVTRKASPNFAYGVGVYVPFGLGQEYKSGSVFRNQVTKVEIQTLVVNPTVAWKIDEVLSVGAGIDFMYGKARLSLAPVFPGVGDLYSLTLKGDGTAWAYNFGLMLTPGKCVKVGFSYRSPFSLEIDEADVELSGINSTVPFFPPPGGPLTAAQVFGGTSFSTKAATRVDMPATAAFGAAYVRGRLTVEADADWTFWSRFRELVIDIRDNNPLLTDSTRPERWRDVVAWRLGAEFRVTNPLSLRAGIAYDPTPVPAETMSPLLPDSDRLFYAVGAGYKTGAWTFDLSYMYLDKRDRTVNNIDGAGPGVDAFNGTWKGDAHLAAFDVAYRF